MVVWRTIPEGVWWFVAALDVYAIFRAVDRGRRPSATLAWMFAILAFPGVGALAYLWLGNPRLKRLTLRRRASARTMRKAVEGAAAWPAAGSESRPLITLAAKATALPPTAGNAVLLLARNEDAFEAIDRSVQEARRSIWAEVYLIRNDESGRRFLDVLETRAKAGVEVRLIYDGVGSLGLDEGRLRAIQAAGGRVQAFLPVHLLRRRWATHLRNHRKIIVVDGETAFTGSLNVGNEYGGSLRFAALRGRVERPAPTPLFRDTHLSLRGPAVRDLAQTFAEDWAFATGEFLPLPERGAEVGGSIVAVVPSGPYEEVNAHGLVYFAGIGEARERCWITSPYFVPDESTLQALIAAAMRGVDVRLLLPFQADVPLVVAAARSYYPELLRGGVRIFEYHRAVLHAKTMVVDGRWGIVGSANVDVRSFQYNFEIGGLVWDPAFAAELERVFQHDQAGSSEVTWSAVSGRPWTDRLAQRLAHLISPLL